MTVSLVIIIAGIIITNMVHYEKTIKDPLIENGAFAYNQAKTTQRLYNKYRAYNDYDGVKEYDAGRSSTVYLKDTWESENKVKEINIYSEGPTISNILLLYDTDDVSIDTIDDFYYAIFSRHLSGKSKAKISKIIEDYTDPYSYHSDYYIKYYYDGAMIWMELDESGGVTKFRIGDKNNKPTKVKEYSDGIFTVTDALEGAR